MVTDESQSQSNNLPPGEIIARELDRRQIPLSERAGFLQYVEAKAKREADLEFLREIRGYKANYL